MSGGYTDEERRILWRQFVEVRAESQKTYDSSIRALAAAGVAVTVSLGTALDGFDWRAAIAVIAFLTGLGANLLSYWTTQRDMLKRLEAIKQRNDARIARSGWTDLTDTLNFVSGASVFLGGVFLAYFVAAAT